MTETSKKRLETPPRGKVDRYDPSEIELRWQQRWDADELYRARIDAKRPKYYFLTMLPYTSGDMHICCPTPPATCISGIGTP